MKKAELEFYLQFPDTHDKQDISLDIVKPVADLARILSKSVTVP